VHWLWKVRVVAKIWREPEVVEVYERVRNSVSHGGTAEARTPAAISRVALSATNRAAMST
jgi:hypothetical protein